MLSHLSQVLPALAVISAICGFLGWSVRGAANKPAPAKTAKPAPTSDKGQQDRAKNLEATLEKSKAANKALKAELETLQASTVSKQALETATAELDAARKALETETKRISTLETDLKKSQETLKTLNARANEGEKAQKDRSFALENELSKTREQLAILQNRPDDSADLSAEIERLRESVAVSTRFAGEMRKREAAAVEALEKAEAQLANIGDTSRPVAATERKIGPVVDSDRIAAAKAEVIRLVELNKQKQAVAAVQAAPIIAEAARAIVDDVPAVVEAAPAIVEETPVVAEEAPAIIEEVTPVAEPAPVADEEPPIIIDEEEPETPVEARVKEQEAPAVKKSVPGELFALD